MTREPTQDEIYAELLAFVDEHGVIPEFEMQRNEPSQEETT